MDGLGNRKNQQSNLSISAKSNTFFIAKTSFKKLNAYMPGHHQTDNEIDHIMGDSYFDTMV